MVSIYSSLILIGITIMAVMAVLVYQARRQAQVNLALLRLNEEVCFDLPDLLRQSWPYLARARFTGLSWQLDWFGTPLARVDGMVGKDRISRHLEAGEITLDVTLWHGGHRGEQRYFSDSLAENFFLLLHVDMWIKMGGVQGAFGQAAKMELFLQHDMKNIAQFIHLAAEQLAEVKPEQEAGLLTTLRAAMPTARVRADRILSALSHKTDTKKKTACPLADIWQQAAGMHGLSARIEGSATAFIAEESLHSIIDNLMINYSDQSLWNQGHMPVSLEIILSEEEAKATATLSDIHGRPYPWPERLFEPFWSEQSKGLGIGLYQARQLAVVAGGSLEVIAADDQPLVFVLILPAAGVRMEAVT